MGEADGASDGDDEAAGAAGSASRCPRRGEQACLIDSAQSIGLNGSGGDGEVAAAAAAKGAGVDFATPGEAEPFGDPQRQVAGVAGGISSRLRDDAGEGATAAAVDAHRAGGDSEITAAAWAGGASRDCAAGEIEQA